MQIVDAGSIALGSLARAKGTPKQIDNCVRNNRPLLYLVNFEGNYYLRAEYW
jgi:hypothetical protein